MAGVRGLAENVRVPHAYDPFLPEFRRDPYRAYRELRESAPVHLAPFSKLWCVSRYEDVQGVLRRDELFSSRAMFTLLMNGGQEGVPPLSWPVLRFFALLFWRTRLNPFTFASARNLIAEDGERHSGLRSIVNRGFTPRQIASREKRAREIAQECVAGLARGERFELVEQLATPLPVTIIAEMLGVEPERRRDFKRWSDAIIHTLTGPGRATPYSLAFNRALTEMIAYVQRKARERRREPADDVLSAIVAEQDGEAGLSDREVVQFVALLLIAGNETTTNLIGNAVRALLRQPRACERLAADPSLAPRAIEETLRWDAPIQLVFRKALEEVEVAGTRIPAGAIVAALIGSANRDERRFSGPDAFELDRDAQGHLAFGFGKHFCLGASLARLEARIALETLAPHLPRLRCEDEPELVDSFLVRGPRRLELR
jgi:cytochrome P450